MEEEEQQRRKKCVSDGRVWGAVAGERRTGDGGRTYGKERKTDVKMDLCIKY